MDNALKQLQALLKSGQVSTSPSVLEQHGRDENFPEVRPPLAVAYAESREDVQTVLEWCRTWRVPLIPFGAGTSLEGALVPAHPDVPVLSLDLSRMNQVVSIQPDNFLAVVQPGVTRTALNEALRYTGMFFPVDPGANASLGGMAATNASGTTTVRYGGMRQNTVVLEVVLASGEVLRLGRPVRKTSSGYDLKDLFMPIIVSINRLLIDRIVDVFQIPVIDERHEYAQTIQFPGTGERILAPRPDADLPPLVQSSFQAYVTHHSIRFDQMLTATEARGHVADVNHIGEVVLVGGIPGCPHQPRRHGFRACFSTELDLPVDSVTIHDPEFRVRALEVFVDECKRFMSVGLMAWPSWPIKEVFACGVRLLPEHRPTPGG